MNPVIPPTFSRRALLRAAALGGGAVVLAGCDDLPGDRAAPTDGVEPDDPATWPADTALLIAARQRVHGYRLGLEAVGRDARVTRELDGLWRAQQERLELLITLGGVPLPQLLDQPAVTGPASDPAGSTSSPDASGASPDPGTGSGDTEAATSSGRPQAQDLGRALRQDRTAACRDLSASTPTNIMLLASLAAQHVASAEWLGAPVSWGPMKGPAGAPAVQVLAATRPAVFGLEVVAARSGGDERTGYEAVLQPLRGITRQLSTLAGDAAPVAPLGYDLPDDLDTPEQRSDLARRLVADVLPVALDAAQRLPGDLDQLTGAVQVVSSAAVWQRRLGATPQPFPGMTLP